VSYVAQLQEAIAFRKPGDVVTVEVARKAGQRATLRVPLQRVDTEQKVAAGKASEKGSSKGAETSSLHALGVSVAALDAATARQLQLPTDVRGVVVTGVEDGSSAATHLATPETGGPDVILSLEGTVVSSPAELRAAVGRAKAGDVVTLRVYNVPSKTRRIERVRVGASN
jgi:serine protease Do